MNRGLSALTLYKILSLVRYFIMGDEYKGVPAETKITKIGDHAQAAVNSNKSEGLIGLYATTAELPTASTLTNGTLVYDEQAAKLYIVTSGSYKGVTLS
jgi:hypothetical protein